MLGKTVQFICFLFFFPGELNDGIEIVFVKFVRCSELGGTTGTSENQV